MRKYRLLISLVSALAVIGLSAGTAFAHVVVSPDQVGIGKTQIFSVGVPTERNVPTVGLRLLLPSNLQEVTPLVKAGWQINVKQTSGGDPTVTEIDWTGGSIPVGFKDVFEFSAQVPEKPTTLQWKAYQTYQDGTVVSWDQTPNGTSDDAVGTKGPYSTTQIIDDLTPVATASGSNAKLYGAYAISLAALAIALTSLIKLRLKEK